MKFCLVFCVSIASTGLSACAVGPDYTGPPNAAPLHLQAGRFVRASKREIGVYPPSRWWTGMKDEQLTDLVELALNNSPNIDVARARVLEARASANGARAELLPKVGSNAAAIRARLGLGSASALGLGSAGGMSGSGVAMAPAVPSQIVTNLYDVGFDASWEIDIFGGRRRAVEGAVAQAEGAEASLDDAKVQLAAEVAQTYAGLRAQQRQREIASRSAQLQGQTLALTRQKQQQGTASVLDVARLETQLATTEADVPPLAAQIDRSLNQMAILCGLEPGELDKSLGKSRKLPSLPSKVAVGDPANMLRRRPDIRQAERQLAASNASIGKAVADYFPKITLMGLASSSATEPHLLQWNTTSLIGGPTLQWSILDFGRVQANVDNAKAQNQEALAQYRQSVLAALEDAETSLSQFEHQNQNVAKLAKAAQSAAKADDLSRDLYKAGTLSLIDALDTQRQRLQSEQALARAEGDRVNNFIGLQKSLGLGWGDPQESVPDGNVQHL